MRTDPDSIDLLRSAVDDVKNLTPAEIAASLAKKRILGRPGTTGRCPLALLMHNSRGRHVVVGQKLVLRQSGRHVDKVATPKNLAAFVRRFDAGKFPELIQVPPRCLPAAKAHSPAPTGKTGRNIHARKRGAARLQLAKVADRFAQ